VTLTQQKRDNWLVVSTRLKNISQNGNLPQVGGENKKYLKHHPDKNRSRILFESPGGCRV